MMKQILLLCTLLVCFKTVSSQTVEQTIFLQNKEYYYLNLEDFYDYPASSFTYPSNLPQEAIRNPFEQFDSQKISGALINPLAIFSVEPLSKYLIGYRVEGINQNTSYNIILVYYGLAIDTITGVLSRQIISEVNLLNNITPEQKYIAQYASSFSASNSGFITVNISPQTQYLYRFEYSSNDGLILTSVSNQYLGTHSVIKSTNGNLFIIYFDNHNVPTLSLFNSSNNILTKIDQIIIPTTPDFQKAYQVPVSTLNSMLLFDYNNNVILNFTIDFTNSKLLVQSIAISEKENTIFNANIQYFGGYFFVYMNGYSYTVIYKLQQDQFINNGELSIIDTVKIDNVTDTSQAFMINENYFLYYQNNLLFMYNISTKKTVFTMQSNNTQQIYSFNLQEFIANQIYVRDGTQNSDGTYNFIPVQFQAPQVQLSNQGVYLFKAISSQSQYGVNIKITVQITQSMVTSINADSLVIWNYLSAITDNQSFLFSVEPHITGSNFNPKIISSSATGLKSIHFSKLINLQTQQSYSCNSFISMYHTDGILSSIIVSSSSNNQYAITAASPNIITKDVNLYQLHNTLINENIGQIDNYGAFLPQSYISQQEKIIYVPFINNNQLAYNVIQNILCDASTFSFTTDPSVNMLFILCGSQIQQILYQQSTNNQQPPNAIIILQSTIIFDSTGYSQLICINGILFIYNNEQIAGYNYINQGMLSVVIQVPQLSANVAQSLVLFRNTFIIIVLNNPILTIAQYSYGSFQNSTPIFLRNFFIDSVNYPINPQLNIIPKRNSIEYLFIGTIHKNEYLIYRVNTQSSQNQFYACVNIPSDALNIPVISSEAICILSNVVSCQKILEKASVSYEIELSQKLFNYNLQFENPIILSIGGQQITFYVEIVRNAATQYGLINQNDSELQKLRAFLQDTQVSNQTIYSFYDHTVYNACLLGWDTQNTCDIKLINRMTEQELFNENTVVSQIMHGLKVFTTQNTITFGDNLAVYSNNMITIDCKVLDDQASKKYNQKNSFSINVYAFCRQVYFTLSISFVLGTNVKYQSATITDAVNQNLSYQIDLSSIQKVITYNGQLTIYDLSQSLSFKLQSSSQFQYFELVSIQPSPSTPISFNMIEALSLSLSFFDNGVIQLMDSINQKDITYQIYQIKYLLAAFSFEISPTEKIRSVQQFNDNQFMVQFQNSFMYEISFLLDAKNELILQEARLYYYNDGLATFNFVLKGSNYILIFGLNNLDNNPAGSLPTVLLYSKQNVVNSQYLIESSFSQSSQHEKLSFAEFISDNLVKCYFQEGGNTIITISDFVQIQFMGQIYQQPTTLSINPLLTDSVVQQISFTVPQTDNQNKQYSISFHIQINYFIIFFIFIVFI